MKRKARIFQRAIEPIESRLMMSIVYVDPNSPGPSQNGAAWNTAYRTLQSAMNAAGATEVRVADGTYKPQSINSNRSATFTLKNGVTIKGGYAGFGSADPDLRDIDALPTILSGDIGTVGNMADNCYHVVTATDNNSTAVLDGVTIAGGRATGSLLDGSGGGAIVLSTSSLSPSTPQFLNCTFQGNIANTGGGAVYNGDSSAATFTNCVFVGNVASQRGGAAFATDGIVRYNNCTFSGNTAPQGASIFVTSGITGMINNCIVWDASDPTSLLISGSPTIQYSDVQGGASGTRNIDADPLFVRNPMPGADRVWGTADDDFGDVHIRSFSPVADKAKDSLVPAGVTTDAGSDARTVNLPNVSNLSGVTTDMGAYEAQSVVAAGAGGSYYVAAGNNLTLTGYGASPVSGGLTYQWEWTGDGQFNDAAGANPTFPAASLPAGTVVNVSLLVTDATGQTASASSTITVVRPYIYVDADATGAGNGTTWEDAFTTLGPAMSAAYPQQTVRVAGGTYKPSSNLDRTATFQLRNGVTLEGGFAGVGTADPNSRDIQAYPTTLSGDLSIPGTGPLNSQHIMTAFALRSGARIDGFTFAHGNAAPSAFLPLGAALYVLGGNITIQSCSFSDNRASVAGAVSIGGATCVMSDCDFSLNSASVAGAVSLSNSTSTLSRCTFSGNTSYEATGGAIMISGGTATLNQCDLSENQADTGGGIAALNSASVSLLKCTMTENTSSFRGGAISLDGGTFSATDCLFERNSAYQSGGAIYMSNAVTSNWKNCQFNGNHATNSGGAISNNAGCSATFTNSTFVGNSSPSGGAAVNIGNITLKNCTLTANSADQGSAVHTWPGLSFINSIVYGNLNAPSQIYEFNSDVTVISSDVQGGYAGTGNIDADPQFVRTPSAGADLGWGTADDDYGDLRLAITSPCIDAGDNAQVTSGTLQDLAGNLRLVDTPNVRDYGPVVDLGALEFQPAVKFIGDATKPTLSVQFPAEIDSATLSVADLSVINVATNSPLNLGSVTLSYDAGSRTALWVFNQPIPDGDYRAKISAGSVNLSAGGTLSSDLIGNVYSLGGDANRDRKVDISDLYILSSNWQDSGKVFSQGDFNYDGVVDAADLAILSGNWQKVQVNPPPATPTSIVRPPAKRTATRIVEQVVM